MEPTASAEIAEEEMTQPLNFCLELSNCRRSIEQSKGQALVDVVSARLSLVHYLLNLTGGVVCAVN
jgi:hypothetical protein